MNAAIALKVPSLLEYIIGRLEQGFPLDAICSYVCRATIRGDDRSDDILVLLHLVIREIDQSSNIEFRQKVIKSMLRSWHENYGIDVPLSYIENIDAKIFANCFYLKNRPFLYQNGGALIQAVQSWSISYLNEKFGSIQIRYSQFLAGHGYYKSSGIICESSLSEFLCKLLTGNKNIYAIATSKNFDSSEFEAMKQDFSPLPKFLKKTGADGLTLWLGPDKSITHLHFDLRNVVLCQVIGVKRVLLCSPVFTDQLSAEKGVFSHFHCAIDELSGKLSAIKVKYFECTMLPGDLLFIPVGWWHQIESLSISLTVGITEFPLLSKFRARGYSLLGRAREQ